MKKQDVFFKTTCLFLVTSTVGTCADIQTIMDDSSTLKTKLAPLDPNGLTKGDRVFIQSKNKGRWDENILFEITKVSDPATSESDVRLEFKAVKIGKKDISRRLVADLGLPTWGRGTEFDFYRCDVRCRF